MDIDTLAEWGIMPEAARELLRQQVCPICRTGPWSSVLNHVSRKHGIGNWDMRNACLLTVSESVTAPELAEVFRTRDHPGLSKATEVARESRARQRWTRAGIQTQRDTLARWEQENPSAAAEKRRRAGVAGGNARAAKYREMRQDAAS